MRLLLVSLFATLLVGQTRVNVGGPMYTDSNGDVWSADTGCTSTSTYTYASTIHGTSDPTLYQTGRTDPSNVACSYTVAASTFYILTLKFAEYNPLITSGTTPPPGNQRIMNVFVNGVKVFNEINVRANAPFATAYDLSTNPIASSSTNITITITQQHGAPMLAALSLLPVGGIVASACTGVASIGYIATATSSGSSPTCSWQSPGTSLASPYLASSTFSGNVINAIASLTTGTVVANQNFTTATTITIPSNIYVTCLPGISITGSNAAADVFALAVGSSNNGITDCNIIGGKDGIAGYSMNGFAARRNVITGFAQRGIVLGKPATNVTLDSNYINTGAGTCIDGIFAEDSGSGLQITNNVVDTTGCSDHGIAVHTFSSGGTQTNSRVSFNTVNQGGSNFGIEVGAFNLGTRIPSPVVNNNKVKMLTTNNGCISIASADGAVLSSNVCDLNSKVPVISGYELPDTTKSLAISNTSLNGGADARAFSIDSSSYTQLLSNQLSGSVFEVNSGTFAGNASLNNNNIIGNAIVIPIGSVFAYAIFNQCNVASCAGSNGRIENNTLNGPANTTSIRIQRDNGTMDSINVAGNIGGVLSTSGSPTNVTTGPSHPFFGAGVPGTIAGNLPGDTYTDSTNHHYYICAAAVGTAAPACTTVGTTNWYQVDVTAAGTVTAVTASSPLASSGGTTPDISINTPVPVAKGGTGTTTPNLIAGSNITITGTWPNQTITGAASSASSPFTASASGGVLTIGAACTSLLPCNAAVGSTVYSFTTAITGTVSAGTDTAYIYVSSAGTFTIGTNSATVVCVSCTAVTGVTSFPVDSNPLYTWAITAGAWGASFTSDVRSLLRRDLYVAGSGLSSSISGGITTFAANPVFASLTTTGTSGVSTLSGSVLNVPDYGSATPAFSSLTTTGTSGVSTLSGGVLNVPNYSAGATGGFAYGGDGSDGVLDFDGTNTFSSLATTSGAAPNLIYTLTRDIFATTLTVEAGKFLVTANFRILANVSITVNGTLNNNARDTAAAGGNAAGSGAGSAGGGGGNTSSANIGTSANTSISGPFGTAANAAAGGVGKAGGTGAGSAGTGGVSNTAGQSPSAFVVVAGNVSRTGASGGAGGASGATSGGGAGAGGGVASGTADITPPRDAALAILLRRPGSSSAYTARNADSGPGSGGSGAGDGANAGGGSGGSGGVGGCGGNMVISSPAIVVGAAGVISANGGAGKNGGNGANGTAGNAGGGGGGGGGNGGPGGIIALIYHTLSNSGSVAASGGSHGTGGTRGTGSGTGNNGVAGTDGVDGQAGVVIQIPQ